jgi:N-acetylglucosaminyldiphosphoundecaprenol N-acetyl-beta-D-mannosaminyltransferase
MKTIVNWQAGARKDDSSGKSVTHGKGGTKQLETGHGKQQMVVETENIVGYGVCREPLENVVSNLRTLLWSNTRQCPYFACLNPHAVELAAADPDFESALKDAGFLTADGVGIVYVSRLFGGGIHRRITGTDIFMGLTGAMNDAGGFSCYFLGSTDETLQKVCNRMAVEFPKVQVCGSYSPPFKPSFDREDTDEMIRRINEVSPDVLWVGMTAPKQEKWIHQNRHNLNVKFAGPVGAVFDFYAGNIRRAGPTWQNLGLEWLPRLIQEPRRLWRRNLISAPSFFVRSVRYHLARPRGPRSE